MRQRAIPLAELDGEMATTRRLDVPIPSIYGPTADEKW
jgi:hypothetical protein